MELVGTSCDEAELLKIQGTTYRKFGVAAIIVRREDRGIYLLAQKEVVAPLLTPQIRTIHRVLRHCETRPHLGYPSHLTGIQCGGCRYVLLQCRWYYVIKK